VLALTCAAVDDVTAWCLLAFVVGIAKPAAESAANVALLTLGFIALMLLVVRPAMTRLASSSGDTPAPEILALTVAGLAASALATDVIGIHSIFGAFLFGAIAPHDSGLARSMLGRPKTIVTWLLLPAFFALAGMRTRIDLVSTVADWSLCGLIVLVATAGKFGGAFGAARLAGLPVPHAAGLGVLMNTRGLMELIVLNIGLDLGVISPALFTMMVIMALATTMMATPLVDLLTPRLVRYNRPA